METILGRRRSAEIDVVPHHALHGMRAERMRRPHACPGGNGLGGRQRNRPIGGAA